MIQEIFTQLEKVRNKNNGHLFFTFTAEGDFLKLTIQGIKKNFRWKKRFHHE
jgi:hypothetical protein